MEERGVFMGSINTSINLHDGMTSVLHSMYAGVSHLVGGFRDMRNTINGGFNESAFNNFEQHMADAIAQMGIMEREAQRAAGTAKQAFDWKRTINFDVFGGGAEERFKSEVNGIAAQMERVISQQRYIENKALNMSLLPRSAVSDIGETSVRLRNLISSMEQLKNVDVDKLSNGQRNKFSTEYESMRQNITAMRQLQKDMGESIKSGDISGVNNGFNQIKSIVEQTEMRLRNFKEALSQVNNFSWQGGGVEIFNTHGLTRAKQEINSAKSMAEGLIQTQQKLTAKAEKMRMLPPNAVIEIQNINKRIGGIGGTIARLEREKNKLSRWNISGINQYNSRIESLRQKIYEAEQAQRNFNNAVRNNDVEALNSAYKQLLGTIDRIDIDIRDNDSAQRQFNSGINAGNRNALNLGNSIRNIGNQLKMYAGMALGGFGLKSAVDITDTYTNLNARLGLITKSVAETKVFQDKLYESAQRTGSSYTDMANTTAKLGLLAGGAFKNNAELTRFSELMAKSFKISGASTQEQAAGMYQLTQAMASGRLQGDEFRSIIENAPMLAQAIQTYTGVSMEGLREMSKEGAISADIIKNSLFLAGAEIEKKFAEMPKTFGSYFSEIKNTALIEFSGIMRGINNAINTDGFKSFIENVKLSIGNAAEWITLRFYEFRVLFNGLWTSAQPVFNAVCEGLSTIRNYIFSANGVLGQLIKTMSRLVSSTGFIDSIKTIAGVFIMAIDGIMFFIQAMSSLISTFDWFGPVLIKVIAAVKVYNIVCAKTQGIMRVLNGIISIFTSTTRRATTAVNSETAATQGATIAQRGLNAAIKANPMGLLASALILVISLFRDLNAEIDEVNSKTGGPVGGGKIRTQYDADVRDYANKQGVSMSKAAEIFSDRDSKNEEVENLKEIRDNWVRLGMGKADYTKWTKYQNAKLVEKSDVSNGDPNRVGYISKAVEVLQAKDGSYISMSEYERLNDKYKSANAFSPYYDEKIRATENQYEKEKWQKINEAKQEAADENKQDEEWQKLIDEMNERTKGLKAGGGAVAPKGKTDVGTVDKIKDTVDVTDEDLKFMRDFAEREVINKIQTTALSPQINVEFSGEIKETVDVNEMIGKVTDELEKAINNSAQGVHI